MSCFINIIVRVINLTSLEQIVHYTTYQWMVSIIITHFILTSHVCFAVTKCPSTTSIYLSVSTIEPSTKFEIFSVMWQFATDSKIQLVSCKIYPKYLPRVSMIECMRSVDVLSFKPFWNVLLILWCMQDSWALVWNGTPSDHNSHKSGNSFFNSFTTTLNNLCKPLLTLFTESSTTFHSLFHFLIWSRIINMAYLVLLFRFTCVLSQMSSRASVQKYYSSELSYAYDSSIESEMDLSFTSLCLFSNK